MLNGYAVLGKLISIRRPDSNKHDMLMLMLSFISYLKSPSTCDALCVPTLIMSQQFVFYFSSQVRYDSQIQSGGQ